MNPHASLIADPKGNLFGTTEFTVFEIAKTARGYASTPTTLVSFNGTDGRSPYAALIEDAAGNLFGTTAYGGATFGEANANGGLGYGTVFKVVKTHSGYASTPTILVSFNGTNGNEPPAQLIAEAAGNLFGTTAYGGNLNCSDGCGTVFEIAKTAKGYASTPTTLVSFNGTDGAEPLAGLIADANGNLFGTIASGGAYGEGTVFEIVKTASGYASTPIILYNFCSQANCTDGAGPVANLIADANGNLFSTTTGGGAYGPGTVFEITGSGFVPAPLFAGTPGQPNCQGQSVSALARQYGGLPAAAATLGYSSVQALQNEIAAYCAG